MIFIVFLRSPQIHFSQSYAYLEHFYNKFLNMWENFFWKWSKNTFGKYLFAFFVYFIQM